MNCPHCGKNLPAGSTTCTHCAKSLVQASVHAGKTSSVQEKALLNTHTPSKQADRSMPEKHVGGRSHQAALAEESRRPISAEEKLAEKKEAEKEEKENERLMIFSDGVIAFALTIAAVSIKIPRDLAELNTTVFTIRVISYTLSFIFVYNLWKEHHSIFHHIKRNDGWLITLNSLYLALVVLIPIGLNIMDVGLISLATHPETVFSSGDSYSFLLFLGALFGASITLPLMWRHARTRRPRDLFGDIKPEKSFQIYTTWRLTILPISLVFYIPAYMLLALNHWYLGVITVIGYTIVRWLFFFFYRRRLQESLDLSVGNEDIMRIQLFSDAIIGIAITITAAQIDPSFNFDDADAATTVLNESWSLLGTYVFSFIIMGVYWLLHYHLFRFIKRYDSELLMYNFIFLLLIILMFIPARMYTSHMNSKEFSIIFSIWQFATAGMLWIMWRHAARKSRKAHVPRLLKREMTLKKRKRFERIVRVNPLIFLVLALAACFIQIPTTFYVIAYLAVLGGTWLISHWSTRHVTDLT
ncbi:MAG TPA: TMEM175 family protein, partial [Ktedonobacteraceae bacterium]|nr:TMEM175 family protein [Ktedonobacteraceae bacterium]